MGNDGTVFEGDWNRCVHFRSQFYFTKKFFFSSDLMAGFGTVVLPIDENAAASGIARMERMYQVTQRELLTTIY